MKMRWLMAVVGSLLLLGGLYFATRQRLARQMPAPPKAKLLPPTTSSTQASSSALHVVHIVTKPHLDAIPPRLAIILGQEDGVSYNVRYAALKKIHPPLASNEVQALYVQLYRHSNEDAMPEDDLHAFKNEVATFLLRQKPLLGELPWHLIQAAGSHPNM